MIKKVAVLFGNTLADYAYYVYKTPVCGMLDYWTTDERIGGITKKHRLNMES